MKINDVLDQIGSDVLTEDAKTALVEAFDDSVNKQVTERLEIEVQGAMERLDEQHAEQLEGLLGTIDRDHTAKLQAVLEKIDTEHTEKLKYLIRQQRKTLNEDAKGFKGSLVKQLSNYLDLYLEDAIPKREIAEAVTNKQAQRTLREIKELVAVDEEFINDTIREAVSDGKKQIDQLKTELNEAVKQNISLNQTVKTSGASLLLEKSTGSFSKEKKDYVVRVLKNKSPDYITENFEYVVKMFDKDTTESRDQLLEEEVNSKRASDGVDIPKSKIRQDAELISESDQHDTGQPAVAEYLQNLQTQDKYK